MDILNTHYHRLVFRIDNNAPKEYMDRWKALKLKCEGGESGPSTPGPNKQIMEQMKEYCKLEQNKELPYLNRCEGGLGGDDNKLNKQIRLRHIIHGKLPNKLNGPGWEIYQGDNDIVFNEIRSTDTENWTYEELDDIIYGFTKMANEYVKAECVDGFIELKRDSY